MCKRLLDVVNQNVEKIQQLPDVTSVSVEYGELDKITDF